MFLDPKFAGPKNYSRPTYIIPHRRVLEAAFEFMWAGVFVCIVIHFHVKPNCDWSELGF